MKPILLLTLVLLGVSSLKAQPAGIRAASMNTQDGGSEASDGWTAGVSGPVSYSLPRAWTASTNENGSIRFAGSGERVMMVWPVFVERSLDDDTARQIMTALLNRIEPVLSWTMPMLHRPRQLRSTASGDGRVGTAHFEYRSGSDGSVAVLYTASAPHGAFDSDLFARIAASVLVKTDPAAAPDKIDSPETEFRIWDDPNERAFSLDVPAGWHVEGGLMRFGSVDTRPHVRIKSADGEILLFAGDAQLPTFAMPSAMLQFAGFPEGSWYSPGYGQQMLVRSFERAADFARSYAETASEICGSITIDHSSQRSETAAAINEIYTKIGGFVSTRIDAGDAAFRCGRYTGYVFAALRVTSVPQGGLWNIERLYGFLAPSNRAEETRTILSRVVQSTRLNPEWVRMQTGLAGNVSAVVAETSNQIAELVREAYELKSRTDDRAMRQFTEYLRGVERIVDPATGETLEVKSGASHFWVTRLSEVIGTDVHRNPDELRFVEAFRLP